MTLTYLSIEQARQRLQVTQELMNALLASGLLGYWSKGQVPLSSIENYEKYGTQWREELGERILPLETYSRITVLSESQGGQQPLGTLFFKEIIPQELSFDQIAKDTGWLAQFYLKPNRFFFPNPTDLVLSGPIAIKINVPKFVPTAKLPTCIYPSPDGFLAMISVLCNQKSLNKDTPFKIAFDIVSPILDQLSFDFDQPLPIAQIIIAGIPSGVLTIPFHNFAGVGTVEKDEMIFKTSPHPTLRDAFALYREAISSNNPFHSFLTLWKVYENSCKIRGEWRRINKCVDIKLTQEIFPSKFAFAECVGMTFDQVKQKLNTPYRVALAHGDIKGSRPKTNASAIDFLDVSMKVPIVRYMSRICLENVNATLNLKTS